MHLSQMFLSMQFVYILSKIMQKKKSNFHNKLSGFIGHTIQMLNLMLLLFQTAKKNGLEINQGT